MPGRRPARLPLLAIALGACLSLAGCFASGGGPGPTVSVGVSATPIPAPVASDEDAAARVIASDARFAGATRLQADSIGLTKWWEASPIAGGGFEITLTLGWGDCQAGCISRHAWVFNVAADGTVTKVNESGDPLPSTM